MNTYILELNNDIKGLSKRNIEMLVEKTEKFIFPFK